MYTILHNSRCGKSRDAIQLLDEFKVDYTVREYLKEELTFEELKSIIKQLGVKPIEIVRTNESIWKEKFKNQSFTDDELIQVMVENPKLIQRPIVFDGKSGVLGRPAENITEFINK